MDNFLDWAAIVFPMLLAVPALMYWEPKRRQKRSWQIGLLFVCVTLSCLIYFQQYRQREKANLERSIAEQRQKTAEEAQRAIQAKLDQSLAEQRHDQDRIKDLKTYLQAQQEFWQVLRETLPPDLRKKAEKIHLHYQRSIQENLQTRDVTSGQSVE